MYPIQDEFFIVWCFLEIFHRRQVMCNGWLPLFLTSTRYRILSYHLSCFLSLRFFSFAGQITDGDSSVHHFLLSRCLSTLKNVNPLELGRMKEGRTSNSLLKLHRVRQRKTTAICFQLVSSSKKEKKDPIVKKSQEYRLIFCLFVFLVIF